MASTFSGLNTALTSLYAQRRGLDITGQNIANASTEGYTRQRVVMQAQNANLTPGIYATTTAVGAGVTVSTVERLRNTALDHRSYTEHANSAYLNEKAGAYALIEDVFAEPSDTALQARLQDMWDGWNAVATNPDKAAPKSALLEQATTVAATLNDASKALNNQFESVRAGLDTYVGDVNKSAEAVAKLNKEIVVAKAAGLQANELMDQRSQEILKLSQMVGATATDLPDGATNVFIGSAPLVSEFSNRPIEIASGSATQIADLDQDITVNLRWKDTGTPVAAGGTMGSQMELLAQGGTLHEISGRLDKVAQKLAQTVNDKYGTGYTMKGETGQEFFVNGDIDPDNPPNPKPGITALNIAVAVSDPADLAVSTGDPTAPAATRVLDGGIADDLAELATSRDGADSEYQQLIGDLGVSAQASIRRRDVQNAVTDQVDAARDAESGVNLDEEMTNLLTYQRGYEAASRVLTTIDSMLDQLINRTGMVGR
ncbi:flagellar hook-associated protein 1 FlgK [Actinoplanes octamycinicus]|uniref:Flagellar hook-associated protein 1 n=1 Tax=Actinoplanes octamycinicus TaxID=135948 RepID=A0A7W7M5E3_9ACTN|nr:flagellar hook-associated protein FlgK [Actinoplanes octamycinicus]MBB4737628.1 flagellar hook-associated protein 1 FlgK [Actinoplanes octamycinicus]GIE57932.1 flagellar hook-associated protein 1 [Actinoplanes octamycinicus]